MSSAELRPARLVMASGRDTEVSQAIRGARDPLAGVLCCTPRRERTGPRRLESDLLRGLGKAQDGLSQAVAADTIASWLHGERVSVIVVDQAQGLQADAIDRARALAAEIGAELFLVYGRRALKTGHQPLLADGRLEVEDLDELLRRLAEVTTNHEIGAARLPGCPPVPLDDFPTFLAAARRRTNRDGMVVVQRQFDESHQATVAWLKRHDRPSEVDVFEHLRRLVASTPSVWSGTAALRGAATALFFHAYQYVAVDPVRFLSQRAPGQSPLGEDASRLLRNEFSTAGACFAVLALASPASYEQLAAVVLTDVAPDGSSVTIGGSRVEIPWHAQGPIRAHLHYRRRGGGTGELPLLGRLDLSSRAQNFPRDAQRISRATGLRFGDRALQRGNAESGKAWGRRHGVSIVPLLHFNHPSQRAT